MAFVTFYFAETRAKEKIEVFSGTPTWGVLELTRNCNLGCRWCYASSQHKAGGETMSKDKAFKVVDILADSGIRQISITGGEPTLVTYLPELVERITSRGMIANLNTNGYAVSRHLTKALARVGLNQVLTNIESSIPAFHDAVRDREGSHKNVLKAIEYFKEEGIKVVVQTVVTTENAERIPAIARFVATLGVNSYRLWDVVGCEEIYPKNWVELLDQYADALIGYGAKSIISYDPIWPTKDLSIPVTHVSCPIEDRMMIFITPAGDIIESSCNDRTPICNILDYRRVQDIPYFKRDGKLRHNSAPLRKINY